MGESQLGVGAIVQHARSPATSQTLHHKEEQALGRGRDELKPGGTTVPPTRPHVLWTLHASAL